MGDGSELSGMALWWGACAALGLASAFFSIVAAEVVLGLGLIGAACLRIRSARAAQDDVRSSR